jgi:hypothetical protein
MKSTKIESLLHAFQAAVKEPWDTTLSTQEKVWFLVYDPADQRKIDLQMGEFELIVKDAGKTWGEISLKQVFPLWMASHEYREEYFADPAALVDQLEFEFKEVIVQRIRTHLETLKPDAQSITALTGVSAVFGFCRLSDILKEATLGLQGRLLVFFPGEFSNNQYRLLDARDGWNYLARPITA